MSFGLDLHRVIDNPEFLPFVSDAAKQLMAKGHYPISHWMENRTDEEITFFINFLIKPTALSEASCHQLMMLLEILAVGEGIELSSCVEEMHERMALFSTMLLMENLYRTGHKVAKPNYKYMTLSEEFNPQQIYPMFNELPKGETE
jgi:hypothetical protein